MNILLLTKFERGDRAAAPNINIFIDNTLNVDLK